MVGMSSACLRSKLKPAPLLNETCKSLHTRMGVQAIRKVFVNASGRVPIDFPEPIPLKDYGIVELAESINLLDSLQDLYPAVASTQTILSGERTTINRVLSPPTAPADLILPGRHSCLRQDSQHLHTCNSPSECLGWTMS